ncbi:major facilitator superfamily domain-containing protein [Entophlyctis helioformis]|nr:major facilitator superfamily domain-containing protein [Entophlyctis helioformis]
MNHTPHTPAIGQTDAQAETQTETQTGTLSHPAQPRPVQQSPAREPSHRPTPRAAQQEPLPMSGSRSNNGSITQAAPKDLSLARLVLLTVCLAGVQFTWTIELAFGTPYLLSLGLAKSLTALVWLAGPLSGLLIQPIIGVYSDCTTLHLGRRRPFMLGGGLLVVVSICMIAFSREIAETLVRLWTSKSLPLDSRETLDLIHGATIGLAVTGFYFLDFSINAVQACCRALIIDVSPLHQQETANAWAGGMLGLGNVLGYFVGYLDLPRWLPALGSTQIQVLCVIAIAWFTLTISATCLATPEKRHVVAHHDQICVWWQPLAQIFRAMWFLPKPIQSICNVQFLAWLGWFPFLFYITSWVADQIRPVGISGSGDGPSSTLPDDVPSEQGTRAGSFALLLFAIVSVVTGFVLPAIVRRANRLVSQRPPRSSLLAPRTNGLGSNETLSWSSLLELPRIWAMSLWFFAVLLLCTILVSDVAGATLLVALCGISWGVAQWVPFALMGECVSYYTQQAHRDEDHVEQEQDAESESDADAGPSIEPQQYRSHVNGAGRPGGRLSSSGNSSATVAATRRDGYAHLAGDDPHAEAILVASDSIQPSGSTRHRQPRHGPVHLEAGMALGIHNIFIVLPQFVSTLMSAIVFAVFAKMQEGTKTPVPASGLDGHSGRAASGAWSAGLPGDAHTASQDPFGWVLRFGALASIWAGIVALRVEQVPHRPRSHSRD